LPVTLIVVELTMLNLEHVVFDIMAGVPPESQSPNDVSYGIVIMVSVFSVVALPFRAIACAVLVFQARSKAA
jgi:hypothetical protein